MFKCIINADDFGKDNFVNEAIIRSLEEGVVTSTTIMANGKCVKEAVAYSQKNRAISYGVHLVLTEGRSFTSDPLFLKNGIIDENGCFSKTGIRNATITPELKLAIFREWDTQVKYLLSLGLDVSHVDSHHHVHHILYDVFDDVLLKNGITKYRNHYFYPFCFNQHFQKPEPSVLSSIKHTWPLQYVKYKTSIKGKQVSFIHNQKKMGLKTSDYFMSYQEACSLMEDKPCWGKCATVELMCHPGHPDYRGEMSLIYNKVFCKQNVKMINYLSL